MAVNHSRLLLDMRRCVEGRKPSTEWRKGIKSEGTGGRSDNYGPMSVGIASYVDQAAAIEAIHRDLEDELLSRNGQYFEDREFRSPIYNEWRIDGFLLAWESLPAGPARELVGRYLRMASTLFAYMSVPVTIQAHMKYKGPGGYPASQRAEPFVALTENASNYTYSRMLKLELVEKRKKPRNVDLLKRHGELFTSEERASLRRIIHGEESRVDHLKAREIIRDVRTFRRHTTKRYNDHVVTYWPDGVPPQNTAPLYYSSCRDGEIPNTPWPFSKARCRQGSPIWEDEVVHCDAREISDGKEYSIDSPGFLGRFHSIIPIESDSTVTLELYPNREPRIYVLGLAIDEAPTATQIESKPMPRKKKRPWWQFW